MKSHHGQSFGQRKATFAKMSTDREECVYLAKLAEQAERYDEMVEEMKKVSKA